MTSYTKEEMPAPLLSVIVPCFNEAEVIEETHRRLVAALEPIGTFEIIYVDDGSTDETVGRLSAMHSNDDRLKIIRLSRNFGHQIATTAGLEHASGRAIVLIDADLQDPPELISEMVSHWRHGYQVVYGVRTVRKGESAMKRWTAKMFYRFVNAVSDVHIPVDTGDFRLMDRQVVEALRAMPERDRFLRGMVAWTGFRQLSLPYVREARFAGVTKYPLRKMLHFASDGVLSFSLVPLKAATILGFAAAGVSVAGMLLAVITRLLTNEWVRGWASLFLAVLFMGGVQLICLGIIGEYIGRIYQESKHRPLYFVSEKVGFATKEERDSTVARGV